MPIERDRSKDNPDHVRREKQSARIVKILQVHSLIGGNTALTVEEVRRIASLLSLSERTMWRYVSTLKSLYETLGRNTLDSPNP